MNGGRRERACADGGPRWFPGVILHPISRRRAGERRVEVAAGPRYAPVTVTGGVPTDRNITNGFIGFRGPSVLLRLSRRADMAGLAPESDINKHIPELTISAVVGDLVV